MHWRRKWQPTSVFLHGGTGEPGGLPSVGLHRVGHNCSDLAAAAAAAAAEVLQLCSFSNCFGSLQGHMNLRTGFSTSQKKKLEF